MTNVCDQALYIYPNLHCNNPTIMQQGLFHDENIRDKEASLTLGKFLVCEKKLVYSIDFKKTM